jgi:hypothetical protein
MTPPNDDIDNLLAEFEKEASLVHWTGIGPDREELPESLRASLNESADRFIRSNSPVVTPRPANLPYAVIWSGWAVAASLLVVVLLNMWPKGDGRKGPVAKSLTEVRRELLANRAARFESEILVDRPRGDIVWDGPTQSGVMRLSGLTPNDPKIKQYQLWIVDPTRPHAEPVDGGVFDVQPDGQALVAVRPSLKIGQPKLFAITEEPPGGVVVSEKGKKGEFVVVMAGRS